MQKFIKRFFLFVFTLLTVVFAIEFSMNSFVAQKSNFKLNTPINYIFAGHSHPACAYNDSLISDLKNTANSGESYFYSYFKTKKILSDNPSVKVVFIEFTNNQLPKIKDDAIWGNMYMSSEYPKYAPFMTYTDKWLLFSHNPSDYINAFALSIKKNGRKIKRKSYDFSKEMGGYLNFRRSKTDSLLKALPRNKEKPTNAISETNLSYLDALIYWCKKKNVKPILVRSPLHHLYPGYSNEQLFNEIRKTRYSNIDYLDFSKFPLSNDEFGDLEHLNYKGAKIYSTWFDQLLKKGLLDNPNKQAFIDSSIKELSQ